MMTSRKTAIDEQPAARAGTAALPPETSCASHSERGVSRRDVLRSTAALSCFALLGCDGVTAAPPPKETGLSYEGLLAGKPGFQRRTLAPLPFSEIPGFLSRQQLARSYAAYRDDFEKLLAAEKALSSATRDASGAETYGALRSKQIEAANSVLLHELYFGNLATGAVEPARYILGNMTEHMGTLDSWREDFIACARVAEAWAVLAYDPYDDRWHDFPLGKASSAGMIGNNPLVVCDVAEDAWSLDYREREAYVRAFLEHLDWSAVASRYRAVDRQ
jgi:Fe-Mn family superoxide dismutase